MSLGFKHLIKKSHKLIRKYNKDVKIIFIGPEPTSRPGDFIFDDKTFVIRGETEKSIVELIKKPSEKILGLTWKKGKKIINNSMRPLLSNKELDKLSFPARYLLNKNRYYNPKLKGRLFN